MSNGKHLKLITSADENIGPVDAPHPLRFFQFSPVPPAMYALLDAVTFASKEGYGFDLVDVARVEAFWEMLDDVADGHGFVLSLRDGRRLYLQLVSARDDDEPIDELEMLPMGDERYPQMEGGGIAWCDEVGEINRLLHS
jgi:hypothetical protein